MITPTELAKTAKSISMHQTEYSFPSQQREGNVPVEARWYTYNSMQTYNFQGRPSDMQGDNWD